MIKRVLCFENPARLSLKLTQMVVELQDVTRTLPIEDIGVVILDHKQITITHALIDALLANNVAIVTSNDKHLPVGLMLPLDGNTLQSERFRAQIDASEPLKKQMWQQTVVAKILGQAHILGTQHIEHNNMLKWAKDVRSGDTDNMEARAAAFYWRNMFEKDAFIRDPQGLPPNNLLNYGYSIVRAMMARALVGAGLLPTLGIHHHSRYDAYCLADDIMEPYRPFVDMKVLEMWSKGGVTSDISSDQKRELLGITTMDVNISGHRSPMMLAIQTTAQSVQKCYSGEARKIIYPDW
ncbi:MAG: type II CRISPR-associated endonuclease Cas1 [Paludibacteraceae bacterium]|nr:type II CRISPR-associated endonuclease Cas1 [Paludibacteraceae bacterium]